MFYPIFTLFPELTFLCLAAVLAHNDVPLTAQPGSHFIAVEHLANPIKYCEVMCFLYGQIKLEY